MLHARKLIAASAMLIALGLAPATFVMTSPADAQVSPGTQASQCYKRCTAANKACLARCAKLPNIAQRKCEVDCENALDSCEKNCSSIESCGKVFETCRKGAKTPAEKAQCITDYHTCKGTAQ